MTDPRKLFTRNPCDDAPSFVSNTASEVSFGNCPGNGWKTNATIVVGGSLQADQEYLWEHQANRSGTWIELGRTTGLTSPTRTDNTIGADGGGSSSTKYSQFRCYVVPIGAPNTSSCRGPQDSNELSKTANLCLS